MRVLVDAVCAEFGGIRTYVEHLLATWPQVAPDDELIVVVPTGSSLPTGVGDRREISIRRPTPLGRPLAQTVAMRRLVRECAPDVVLATLPSTTVRSPGAPMAVVLYDLRHEILPEQFTARQRLLRRISYGRGYALADGFLSISHRSLDDLHRLHPELTSVPARVAHLGADHVRTWPADHRHGAAVAFAHHTNKNVDLVLDGWAELLRRGADPGRLVVCGVPGALRESLQRRILDDGMDAHVELASFLSDDDFARLLAGAGLIAFPSSFEGFGLPVVEGMLAGVPVVIGPEGATLEVAGGHAFVLADWTADAMADAVLEAQASGPDARAAAAEHAATFTWERTVRVTRELLQTLVADAAGQVRRRT